MNYRLIGDAIWDMIIRLACHLTALDIIVEELRTVEDFNFLSN